MPAKKLNYIDMELEWLEMRAEEQRAYVDSHPLTSLTDRVTLFKMVRGERVPIAVQNIEAQHKNIRETLKDYLLIIEGIARLREKEATKKMITRGDQELTPMESGDI